MRVRKKTYAVDSVLQSPSNRLDGVWSSQRPPVSVRVNLRYNPFDFEAPLFKNNYNIYSIRGDLINTFYPT